jgi:GAF domain-containing protein
MTAAKQTTGDTPKLREAALVRTFVELTDTLVDDFDVVELLTVLAYRCVDVLDVAAAGLMLVNNDGELRVVASSSDAMRLLELFEVQAQEGPCMECYSSGNPVVHPRLATDDGRWSQFSPRALAAGFHSVQALPMRLRGQTIGALNLFRLDEGALAEADLIAAQAFADVATIAILQNRAAAEAQAVNDQLNNALNSRVVIEQAKGMVAERAGLDMEQAFNRLRSHARSHNLLLVDVARSIIDGSLSAGSLDPVPARRTPLHDGRRV